MDQLVRLCNVTKDYASFRALNDISLEIGPGITGLLGPNGAGKTTLIKLLLGLVQLTRGSGEVLGEPLGTESRSLRANVGYMPEDDCYVPGLSGVEMLQFVARLSRRPAIESLRRAHEILDYCHIGQERYRHVETYSTGMRQQLKFAMAIVHDPRLLILDEPTSGLDPDEREAMLCRIRSLSVDHGKAVLISTHILPDVQAISDRVVIMVDGSIRVTEKLSSLRQPAVPAYRLRVSGGGNRLAEQLRGAGYTVNENQRGELTVERMDAPSLSAIWQWAAEAGVGVTSLAPVKTSLEDVFLAAIREGQVAHQ